MTKAESARHGWCYYLWLAAIGVLVALDQWTKQLAVQHWKAQPQVLIPGVLELSYTENTGMAFGLLANGRILFLIFTAVMIAALLFAYVKIPAGKRYYPLSAAVIFILGGAIGNLIDRVRLGYVVDFIYIRLINFPLFNLADCFVTWTAVLVVILLLFKYKDEEFRSRGKAEAEPAEKES